METRNFYLLIVSIMIGISVFWLSAYSFIILDIDPLQNIKNIFGGDDVVILTIRGNVVEEKEFTLSDIKSDNYIQIQNREFHIVNAIGREYYLTFSGVSLWSVFDVENLLNPDSSTFLFIGGDGYYAETALPLTLSENFTDQVILAYEQDGQPLFLDGPLMSVVDHELIPDKATTHYSIKNLKTIVIQ